MKYAITGQQAFFFERNKYIEFEHLLADTEGEFLCRAVKNTPSIRNVSLSNIGVRKILFSKGFAELAGRLSIKRMLRFGLDQVFRDFPIPDGYTVAAKSAIAPLACCLMLCVDGPETKRAQTKEGCIDPFPQKVGSGVFFHPNTPWDAACSEWHKDKTFILVAYAEERVQYLFCFEDPFVHELKKQGLVFGDRLPETSHPFLLR